MKTNLFFMFDVVLDSMLCSVSQSEGETVELFSIGFNFLINPEEFNLIKD